jgi:hypothetical protein
MRMVKNLLLGSAAGIVVVAGAQAADLPVKAKPVEYVKICSLYGDGFYYIPGTDTCIQVGGNVQADYDWNAQGNGQPHYTGAFGAQDRTVSANAFRGRADLAIDTRTQTAYGTLRTFEVLRIDNLNQGTISPQVPRAFIQWAGFTFGHTKSFTDPFGQHGGGDFEGLAQCQLCSDSGANGTNQIAYTYEMGNGNSLSIGADERRTKTIVNLSNAGAISIGAANADVHAGMQYPDPWVAFKSIQSWGKWSVSFIGHNDSMTYYGAAPGIPGYVPGPFCTAQPATTLCNHADDKWGWAVLSGFEAKAFWDTPGSRFGAFFNYSQGATVFASTNLVNAGLFGGGNQVAVGISSDAVFVNGSGLELTTQWTVGGAYEHYWTSNFTSKVLGGFSEIKYDGAVVSSRVFCGSNGGGVQNILIPATTACDPGFKYWTVSGQTNWYPVPGFRLAVEVLYLNVETAFNGAAITLSKGIGARPTGVYTAKDQGILAVYFRAQRRFPSASAGAGG